MMHWRINYKRDKSKISSSKLTKVNLNHKKSIHILNYKWNWKIKSVSWGNLGPVLRPIRKLYWRELRKFRNEKRILPHKSIHSETTRRISLIDHYLFVNCIQLILVLHQYFHIIITHTPLLWANKLLS